jgi:hypothetical protein
MEMGRKIMYKELILYRNELKNSIVPRYKITGIVVEIVLSKEIFRRNSDMVDFLTEILGMTVKGYLLKSRTLIVAHCCRLITKSEDKEYVELKKKLYKYIDAQIKRLKEENDIKLKKNNFDGWIH